MARIFFQATPQDDLDLGLGLAQPLTFIVCSAVLKEGLMRS
jgi:hypothetical protein